MAKSLFLILSLAGVCFNQPLPGVPKGLEKKEEYRISVKLLVADLTTVFYGVCCTYKFSAHLNLTMIFGKKSIFIFQKENYKFIHHKSYLKPFLSYLPCIVRREYFSIIFNVKKCTLHLIKYSNQELHLSVDTLASSTLGETTHKLLV